MLIRKIYSSNDCGGFKPPKGHLDTQMYPECEGTETDRDIVKKTEEKRKKKKKKASTEITAKHKFPIVTHDAKGLWQKYQSKQISTEEFVDEMAKLKNLSGFPGLTDNSFIRNTVIKILEGFESNGDYESTAMSLNSALAADEHVTESDAQKVASKNQVSLFNLKRYVKSQTEGREERYEISGEQQDIEDIDIQEPQISNIDMVDMVALVTPDGSLVNKKGKAIEGSGIYDLDFMEYPAGITEEGVLYVDSLDENDNVIWDGEIVSGNWSYKKNYKNLLMNINITD